MLEGKMNMQADLKKNAIDLITWDEGLDYHCLDDEVVHHSEDIDWILYSCLLYEQSKVPEETNEHIRFWENEKLTGSYLNSIKKLRDEKKLTGWPHSIGIECTTICCAKCTNCTHELVISSGIRKINTLSYEEACYRIRKAKLYSLVFSTNNTELSPAGLGDPFCYSKFFDILDYTTHFFENVTVTTNAFLLNEEKAKRLAQLPLTLVSLSLSYFEKEVYEREIGMNYDTVIQNMIYYLEQRKQFDSTGQVTVHIFDNSLSTKESYRKFVEFFAPHIRKDDRLAHRPYYEFNQNHIKTNQKCIAIKACSEPWHIMMIDVDGYIYPCYMGVWKAYDENLSLGKIGDPLDGVVEKLKSFRASQFMGDFEKGGCNKCPTLRHYTEFILPMWMYHQKKCINGAIAVKDTWRWYDAINRFYLRGKGWIKRINSR